MIVLYELERHTCLIQITIDTSPPHEGSVHEGFEDEPEVDFQQTLDISAHWKGFFDRESGVWFYLYTVSLDCKSLSEFDIHNHSSQVHINYMCRSNRLSTKCTMLFILIFKKNV